MPKIPEAELRELRQRVSLVSLIGRRVRLQKQGPDYFGLCPFHGEKSPSFSVNPEKGFFHCFGCGAHGDVLDWIMRSEGVSFRAAVERARIEAGASPTIVGDPREDRKAHADEARQRLAWRIWEASEPISGTVAETYLRIARGVSIEIPESLRFHRSLKAGRGRDAPRFPAMVAKIVHPTDGLVAIQRTFLRPDGRAKAPIDRPKMALGSRGSGAVRLGVAARVMGVCEGIETGLSAQEMFAVPVWCALGSNLSKLWLPPYAERVIVFADRGEAGEKAAETARREFRAQGRKVAVKFPAVGDDFNDMLRARRNG